MIAYARHIIAKAQILGPILCTGDHPGEICREEISYERRDAEEGDVVVEETRQQDIKELKDRSDLSLNEFNFFVTLFFVE